jgi:hypothetical protein
VASEDSELVEDVSIVLPSRPEVVSKPAEVVSVDELPSDGPALSLTVEARVSETSVVSALAVNKSLADD